MTEFTKYVGMDVHAASIAVAVADTQSSDVRFFGQIANTAEAMLKLVKQLSQDGAALSFCYEAGPCGYGLNRQLIALGHTSIVVAPSLIPKKAGDRVKTDRRDSLMLARLLRAGELTAVWVPDDEHEALRDLTRARGDLKDLERRARQRLLAFLLRHARRYGGKSNWTQAHFRWLETVKFDHPTHQIVLQEYIDTVQSCTNRVLALDKQIERSAQQATVWPVIEALMALRGVQLLTATITVAEIGDLTRFASPAKLMAYLGLVPSEHSSGAKQKRGGITKTGNSHVRRVLVEAAWTYRFAARKTRCVQKRAEKCDERVQAIAWKAQKRLCDRYQHFINGGKLKVQACTAVARELAGFIWAIGQEVAIPIPMPMPTAVSHQEARC
jgi:transposase